MKTNPYTATTNTFIDHQTSPRSSRHIRKSSIDKILAKLDGPAADSSAEDPLLKEAFDSIMLSGCGGGR